MKKNIIDTLVVVLFSLGVFFLNNELEKIFIHYGINIPMPYFLHWFITLPSVLLLVVLLTDENDYLEKRFFWFCVVTFIIIFIIINSFFAWKINTDFRQWLLLTLTCIAIIGLLNWLIFKILNFTQKIFFDQKKKTVKLSNKIINCIYQVFYPDICAYNFKKFKPEITIDNFANTPLSILEDFLDQSAIDGILSKLNKIFFSSKMLPKTAKFLCDERDLMSMFYHNMDRCTVKDLAEILAIVIMEQTVSMITHKRSGFQNRKFLRILRSWSISFKPAEIKKFLKTADINSPQFGEDLFKVLN